MSGDDETPDTRPGGKEPVSRREGETPDTKPTSRAGRRTPNDPETLEKLNQIRRRVYDRTRELSLPLEVVSRDIGRNVSYLHQYVTKGSPVRLPEDVRALLAARLGIPEEELRIDSPLPSGLSQQRKDAEATTAPLYSDRGQVAPGAMRGTTQRPAVPGAPIGFWISTPRGRLQPGDIAFAVEGAPVRAGDIAALIHREGGAVLRLGTASEADDGSIVVDGAAGERPLGYQQGEHSLMKVVAIHLA